MILPFSTQFNGKPNYFIEKIWEGLFRSSNDESMSDVFIEYIDKHEARFGKRCDEIPDDAPRMDYPKIHTIRKDENNRWKAGIDIHFYINNRSKNAFQFAPVVRCTYTQEIRIDYSNALTDIPIIYIDSRRIWLGGDLERLALQDGFDSIEDFCAYFNEDFTGKIIHWTNYKY